MFECVCSAGISECGPAELDPDTWKLGYCSSKLQWEQFHSRAEAENRYRQLWWSRILVGPDGHVVMCSTAILDPKGLGMARLIISAKRGFSQIECAATALEQGEVAFIPPERLPGATQAVQLIWQSFAGRTTISLFGSRVSSDALCYFDVEAHPAVRGYVALTIDDAPGRLGRKNSMLPEVRKLLKEYDAKATFMLMGKFVPGHEEEFLQLLRDGHELGNHGLVDRSYAASSVKEFEGVVDECCHHITSLQRRAGVSAAFPWFRPPHGKMSSAMSTVVEKKGLKILMCDTYACCPVIQDGDFVGSFLAQRAEHGSILLIHMPEHGFREWCWLGLQTMLRQLQERGLKVVTAGKLAERAGWAPERVCSNQCKLAL